MFVSKVKILNSMQSKLLAPTDIDNHQNYTQQIFTKDHAHIEEYLISKFSSCRSLSTYHDNIMIQYITHVVSNQLNFRQVLIIFRNKSQNTGYVNLISVFSSLLNLISHTTNLTPQYIIECYKSILTVFRNYQMFLLDELVTIYTTTIKEMFVVCAEHFKNTYLKRFSENFLILERMQSYVPEKDFLKFYEVYRTVRLSIFSEYIKLDMFQHAYRLITPLILISNKNEINIFDSFEKEDLELLFDDLEIIQRQQFNLLGLSCLELERHYRKHNADLIKGAHYVLCNRDLSNRFESKLPIERDTEENVYKIITEEKKKFEHKTGKNKDFVLINENMDIKSLIEDYIKELKNVLETDKENNTVKTIVEVLEYILYPESFLTHNILNIANNKELLLSLSNLKIDISNEDNKDRLLFLIVKTTIYKIYDLIMGTDDKEILLEELYGLLCIEEDIEESELLGLINIEENNDHDKDDKKNKNSSRHYSTEFNIKFKFFDLLFNNQIDIKRYVILLLISVNKHIIKVTEDGIKLQKLVSNIKALEHNKTLMSDMTTGVQKKKEMLNVEEIKKEILDKGLNIFKEELKRGHYNLRKFYRDNKLVKREIDVNDILYKADDTTNKKEELKQYINTTNECDDKYKEEMDLFINDVNGRVNDVYNKEIGDFKQLASEIRHMKNTTLFIDLYTFNKKKQKSLEIENLQKKLQKPVFNKENKGFSLSKWGIN